MTDYNAGYQDGYADGIKDAGKKAASPPWEETPSEDVKQRFMDWAYDQIGDNAEYDEALNNLTERVHARDLDGLTDEQLRQELDQAVEGAGLMLDVDGFIGQDRIRE